MGTSIMIYSRENILSELKKICGELFGLKAELITTESKIYEDLDLDSIDAIDLIVQLQNYTNKKFEPSEFKKVQTIGDIVEIIFAKMSA
jgi:acyl carrier protein